MPLSKDTLVELYRKMILVRSMEDMHLKLLKEGRIILMAHVGTGQEAVPIGVTGPLRKDDILFGTHRGVGEYIGKGMLPKDIWLEYLGKRTSPCKGKGGLHLADRKNNIPGLVSSLGADFSLAVGTALASKMQKKDQVILCFFGEGTCNQADFHPSMCMASLWKLPIVFALCTNQFCGMSCFEEHYPTKDVAPRAAGYGIPYEVVDGQDITLTYEATEKALEHVRSGKGPFFVEFKTFRMFLHFSGDPGGYVDQKEWEKWRKRDPLDLCQQSLLAQGILTPDDEQKIRKEIQAEVEDAVNEAYAAPDPTVEDLFEDVYTYEGAPS
jgi:pyruvate dehydrogenase E1 component alpha subunit